MTEPRKRVAVVVPSLTGAGAERVAQTLAREFARASDVTVVTMEPRVSAEELREAADLPWADRIPAGCAHVHLPSGGSGLRRLVPLVVRFARLARRERFDVVYSFLTWTNVLVAGARAVGGRYVHVASEHAMAESLRSDGDQLALLARTLPFVYRFPDVITVVSDAARASLLAAGVLPRPERAVTVPNPVDVAEIRRLAEERVDVELPVAAAPLLVCVARLHVQKDHDTLLRALLRLPASCALVLIGDGPRRDELRRTVADLGLADRVTFTGMLANPYPVMRRADALVLASREEGFGLVAAEAAALEVPFVGSRVGGLAEVCAELGHPTFPPGDDAALAAAILELTADREGRRGTPELVDRLYGPTRIAERYAALADGAGLPSARAECRGGR